MTLDEAAGQRLGRSITDHRGNVLLHAGVDLTPLLIAALRQRGFRSVPVHDRLAPEAAPADAIREETRRTAAALVEDIIERSRTPGAMTRLMPAVNAVVDQIVDDIGGIPDMAFYVESLRSVDDVLLTHSVNVCVLAIILGRSLALDPHDMRRLGTGALLHDIGKIYFLDLARKPGALTPEEHDAIKRHTTEGFRLLRDQGDAVHLLSATIALQHHERLDGSGYPRGLREAKIHTWAQLTAVVDIFDTVTGDLPYRDGKPPHQAMAELVAMAGEGKVAPRLVNHLMWHLAAYPEGTILLLKSGEVGVVVGQSHLGGQCPRVRVVSDGRLRPVPTSERLLDASAPGTTYGSVLVDYPPDLLRRLRLPSAS